MRFLALLLLAVCLTANAQEWPKHTEALGQTVVVIERIKMATKVDITHVLYQPAQAVGAAVAGHTQIS